MGETFNNSIEILNNCFLHNGMECDTAFQSVDEWNSLVAEKEYAPLQYKIGFLRYQCEYFTDVFDEYKDISVVIKRGGAIVSVWPLCIYRREKKLYLGTAGGELKQPLLSSKIKKTETQRSIYRACLRAICEFAAGFSIDSIMFGTISKNDGIGQWQMMLMENGGRIAGASYQLFTDLTLSLEEISNRIRRTNKYSIAKGNEDYLVEVYDDNSEELDEAFEEFRNLHIFVSGRETRSKKTWDLQKEIIKGNSKITGYSFVVFIRDKTTGILAGAALFDSTPSSGLYCVAAYDRSRFNKPVGHVVQSVAMRILKEKGIRWYEIGERTYPCDLDANEKLLNISHYKEGFATNVFPIFHVAMDKRAILEINSGIDLRE